MIKRIGGIAAIIGLAVIAFTAAYFGGGLLTQADPVEPAGAALHAPQLAVKTTPVAMVTPTATPSPKPTATPKPKKHHKKHTKKTSSAKQTTTTATRTTPVAPVATAVATAVPTRVPYTPQTQTKKCGGKKKGGSGVIIED
jgi:hypothetical protein